MVEHLLEVIHKPRILHDRIHPQKEPRARAPSRNLENLLDRIKMRKWVSVVQDDLMQTVIYLRRDVKFIEHLPKCRFCLLELELDVERYLGTRSFWFLCLENNEYLEQRYRSCPRERNYKIGNYWEQAEHFRKYGNTDTGDNTLQFILDRADWAYKIYAKQIHVARQLLRLVRAWNFSEAQRQEYGRLCEQLGMYEVALPFD